MYTYSKQVPETILVILDYQNLSILLMVNLIEFNFVLLVSLDLYSTFLKLINSIDKSCEEV